MSEAAAGTVPLRTIALDWTRIGVTGFGGPPTHIALLRRLVVDREHWIDQREFEDALAACNLLPGPASTQLAIFLARRVAGPRGAVVGGPRLHRPGGRPDHRAVDVVPGLGAARVGAGRGRRRGRSGGRGRRARCHQPGRAQPRPRATARPLVPVCAYSGSPPQRRSGRYLVLVLLGCGLVELGDRPRTRRRRLSRARLGARLGARRRWRRSPAPAGSGRWRGWRSRSGRCPTAAAS